MSDIEQHHLCSTTTTHEMGKRGIESVSCILHHRTHPQSHFLPLGLKISLEEQTKWLVLHRIPTLYIIYGGRSASKPYVMQTLFGMHLTLGTQLLFRYASLFKFTPNYIGVCTFGYAKV